MVDKELAVLGKDKSGEGRNWMDNGAGGRGNDHIKIWALKYRHLMPVHQEKGARGSEGATSDIRRWVVVELLWI